MNQPFRLIREPAGPPLPAQPREQRRWHLPKSPRQNPETDSGTSPKPGHGFWWGPLGGDPDTEQAPGVIV